MQAEQGVFEPLVVVVVVGDWWEDAARVRRRATIQSVLLGYQNERLYWSWRVQGWQMLHDLAGVVVVVVVEERKFLDEDEILFAEGTVALEAKAEAQRSIPIVLETSALERQAGDPYYWVQRSTGQ